MDDVMVLIFSEFGRRAAQNGSNGTDHGKANNVFVISTKLNKAGIFNSSPDLEKLDEGDVAHTVDFRSIYATILHKWLGANDTQILGRKFDKLYFV